MDEPLQAEMAVGTTRIGIELFDHPVAREFAGRMPFELELSDLNGVEMAAPLPAPLTVQGVPDEDAPGECEIGYFAPKQMLALYYADFGRSIPGVVRLGRLACGPQLLEAMPDRTVALFSRRD
jgi:hypothetical protein